MRVLLFATALFTALASASMAMACTSVEHVSASKPEYVLTPGSADACLRSTDGRYELHMQAEGTLALYDNRHPGHVLIWSPKMSGPAQPGSKAMLRNDGSFVVVDPAGKEIWRAAPSSSAAASGAPGDFFVLVGGKGRVEVYRGTTLSDPARSLIWASAAGDVPDQDGQCQCHVVNTDGSPGSNSGDPFATCGLMSCRSTCAAKKDYFGDNLIGTYNKGTGKCRAF